MQRHGLLERRSAADKAVAVEEVLMEGEALDPPYQAVLMAVRKYLRKADEGSF